MTYDYAVDKVVRVIDGDTFDLTLSRETDFGFYMIEHKHYSCRFRLHGVDCPERGSPLADSATEAAAYWLAAHAGHLRARTHKADSFGRWLVELYCGQVPTNNLSDELVRAGLAVPYRKA